MFKVDNKNTIQVWRALLLRDNASNAFGKENQ